MLAYILAVLVGSGSVGLYIAAFFFPEIHRKHDFIWSGVGCFYALALWIYAREFTGGILVGQAASVALLGWFVWQTLKLRRQLVPVNQQTPIPNRSKFPDRLNPEQSTPLTTKPAPKTPTRARSKNSSPAAISSQEELTVAETAAVDVDVAIRVKPNPPPAIADTASEDEEAWIKLEVKPAPQTSKPTPEVIRSIPKAPQPIKETIHPPSPSSAMTLRETVETPPPSSAVQPVQETLQPTAQPDTSKPIEQLVQPAAQPTATPKPVAAAIQPPTALPSIIIREPTKPLDTAQAPAINATTSAPNPPADSTQSIDRLIAELESEVKDEEVTS